MASILGVTQNLLFMQPWFRRFSGLSPLPPPEAPAPPSYQPPANAGPIATAIAPIKGTWNEAKEKISEYSENSAEKNKIKQEKKAVQKKREQEISNMWRRMKEKR